MLVMRPVRLADLPRVQQLAVDSPVGVTSLPDNTDRLREKILASEASFAGEVSFHGEESYLFVLEDLDSGSLIGCSGIVASAGFSEPFYSFRNETFVHASRELNIHNKVHVLSLCHDLTGHSLLTGFYIKPDLANSSLAELNSRGRLLFIASHPDRFADVVVAEIVGYSDEENESPFWNGVGRNFFNISYSEAEELSSRKSRTFLAEVMPHYPLYVPLLSGGAQEAMASVHPRAQTSFDIFMREGFESDRYIDIFDGGPTLQARTACIRSISHSDEATVLVCSMTHATRTFLVTNGEVTNFRAVVAELDWQPGTPVMLAPEIADALIVGDGASVRLVAL
jgi:arginine N-succinyltransferase